VGEVSTRGQDGKDVRSAAQIEADIVRTRQQLAATLDELAVAVHPSTLIGSAKAQVRATVEEKTGKAYAAVNRSVEQVKAQFVDEKGSPRKERIVPVAVAGAALVAGLVLLRRRKVEPTGRR
jgi:MYXO-CTERM domain-containing protein